MLKAYIFLYDNQVGTRDEVKEVLNSIPSVQKWRYDIPHSFYVVSNSSAQELYQDFTNINGAKGRYMFMEANSNRQGQMQPDTWYLLTHKEYKPKDK